MKKEKNRNRKEKSGIYIFLAENKRLFMCAFVFGIPAAVSSVLGWRLNEWGTVLRGAGSIPAAVGNFFLFLAETAVLSVPFAVCAMFFLRKAAVEERCRPGEKGAGKVDGEDSTEAARKHRYREKTAGEDGWEDYMETGRKCRYGEKTVGRPLRQMWLFYAAVILLCWLPVYLAYYPSVFAYDAEGQLYQVIAKDYSTHHPLLHTLFLGAFFRMGGALGSYSAGMAVHSAVQMLLMAGAFAWALTDLYAARTVRWTRMLLLFFFAVFPAHAVLALSTTKDVLFSALALLYTLCLRRLVRGGGVRGNGKFCAVYVAAGVFMLLFRNNAVYAFLVSVPVIYIGLGKERHRAENGAQETEEKIEAGLREKRASEGNTHGVRGARRAYLCMAALTLALYGICAFSLKAVTHAQNGSPREMLSVPLQQMARARVKAEEKIDPRLRQELEKYIPAEWVFAAYNPHLADPVKNRAVIHDDPVGLIRTWAKLGLAQPSVYIDAFLDNSLGLWYLWDTSHAQIYGIGTESGFGYLSTDNRTMPAGCEIVEHSLFPGFRAFMEKIVSDNAYSRIPVARLLFAPALYWWLLYLYIVTAFYRKRYSETLPAVFLAAYYLTLLLSPAVLVRYAYPLMVTVPVLLPGLFSDTKRKSENIQ